MDGSAQYVQTHITEPPGYSSSLEGEEWSNISS